MPVEIGETAKQRAIVEGGDVGKLGQPDKGKPHADEAVAAHRLQCEAVHRGFEDRGAAQPLGVGAQRAARI